MSSHSSNEFEKFTVFLKLPKELRELIWTHALPPPRLIKIHSYHLEIGVVISTPIPHDLSAYNTFKKPLRTGQTPEKIETFLVTCLLQTTKESRSVAKRSYTVCGDHQMKERGGREPNGPIWIDLSRDIVYFERYQSFMNFLGCPIQLHERDEVFYDGLPEISPFEAGIQSIIVEEESSNSTNTRHMCMVLGRFRGLKKVVLNLREASHTNEEAVKIFETELRNAAKYRGLGAKKVVIPEIVLEKILKQVWTKEDCEQMLRLHP